MLKILLQILIFSIFIFSNGYQSLVTSFMLQPLEEKLLKSIDELLDSDFNIMMASILNLKLYYNPKYLKALKDKRIFHYPMKSLQDFAKMRVATTQCCAWFDYLLTFSPELNTVEGLYKISEPFSLIPFLWTGYTSPYVNRLNELMRYCFEGGLLKAWNTDFEIDYANFFKRGEERIRLLQNSKGKKNILDLETIAPFFLILVFGNLVALLALLGEIFYHDFLCRLSGKYLKKLIDKTWKKIYHPRISDK